ncbi:tRNA dihydrouridine synthase [Salidesulfovibrio onnuriiensis]|uniref:tRNA dihydrouridine synthase n=1 Tax=Salidesulfovibrio onnuriiensis TaxID=2583823 RepID=UPI0011CC4B8F|nr:tRNA-dihydrouridine synthase family protein [Salidesulfovibrio onnuriiensis]
MTTFEITPDSPWLAPLAGYSDLPFRLLCRSHGAGVTCSEMVSVKGLSFKNSGTRRLLNTCPDDEPVVIQIFGAEPQYFPETMEKLVSMGFRNFDLNCGCAVRKVMKSGSGVALMRDVGLLVRIAGIMVEKAAQHPDGGRVGVKFRLGPEYGDETYLDLAPRLEDIGVNWVTMHPRYGKQLFRGDADWNKLRKLKDTVSIPVIASGDLYTARDGVRCIEETGVDGVMFARGAMFDPTIFDRFRALRAGREMPPLDGTLLAEVVRQHIKFTKDYEGDGRSFRKIRSIIPRYAKGLEGIRALRGRLNQCASWEDLETAASEIETMKKADRISTPVDDNCL